MHKDQSNIQYMQYGTERFDFKQIDLKVISQDDEGRFQDKRLESSLCLQEDNDEFKKKPSQKYKYFSSQMYDSSLNISKLKSKMSYKIKKTYLKLKKINPKLFPLMKNITSEINTTILIPQYIQQDAIFSQRIQTLDCIEKQQQKMMMERNDVLNDDQVMKESCYRNLLVQAKGDNDVSSDDEDLNLGIRYMYGQLLYSIGNQMINKRQEQQLNKIKQQPNHQQKPNISTDINKQNENTNNNNTTHNQKNHKKTNKATQTILQKIKPIITKKSNLNNKIANIIRN